jgi:ABC-type branched-subunit amino acid transport system ATPase component
LPILELREITVRFGGILALTDLSLEVGRGEILGLIGPNGAGKTTLFDVISGVRPPDHGAVVFDGREVTRKSATVRAQRGMRRTFQRVQTFGWLSVEDNLLAALEWRGGGGGFVADLVAWPMRRRRERSRRATASEVLELCGLSSLKADQAASLPIGLARMVELARALVDRPALLLLDEPASGLDETEANRLGEIMEKVRAERGCSIVLVEHNAGFVMDRCDRVVVLDQGQVLAQGTPASVQADARVQQAYLGIEA